MSRDRVVLAGRLPGERYVVVVDGVTTGGALAAVEIVAMPGGGAPLHRHRREAELFHVLDGGLELTVGDARLEVAAGESALVPRGVPHAFRTAGDAPARFVVVYAPAGPEAWFAEAFRPLGAGAAAPAATTVARMREAGPRHGIEWLDAAP